MKEELLDKLRQYDQNDGTTAQAWYELGNAFRQHTDWQHALECYNHSAEMEPAGPASKAREMLMNILEYRCRDIYNP